MIDLFLDTETTGFISNDPYDSGSQPDCVQLAAQLYDDRKLISEFQFLLMNSIQPIQPGAAKVHGITQELISTHGVNPKLPLTCLKQMLSKADRVIAFNMAFDWKILKTAFFRSFAEELSHSGVFCTMLQCHGRVPKPDGSKRWPKLSEAYEYLVNPKGFDGAHDAMIDVRALVAVTHAAQDRDWPMIRVNG